MILECKNLTFAYEGKEILKNVSLSINEGEYVCIIGENGAGKSTLVKGILGLIPKKSGEIIFYENGKVTHKRNLSYLPQKTIVNQSFKASVKEVVSMGRLNTSKFKLFYNFTDKKIINDAINLFGIEKIQNKCFLELSGGQQQKVLLARSYVASDKLIILDEPVTGLDPIASSELYELLIKINKEKKTTIMMISHDINESLKDATHVIEIGDAKILFFGKKDDFIKLNEGKALIKK